MPVPAIDNAHVAEGQALLTSRYQPLPNISGLTKACMEKFQQKENDFWSLLNGLLLANAPMAGGPWDIYDKLAALVGVPGGRIGRDDADLVQAIKVQIRINRSNGLAEDIIQIVSLLQSTFTYNEYDVPASFEVDLIPTTASIANALIEYLDEAKSGGTYGTIRYATGAGPWVQLGSVSGAVPLANPWTPMNLPNLMAWYRADLGVTAPGGVVSQWNDSGGSGDANRNLVQATSGLRPTLNGADPSFNGQPSIAFTTSGACLRSGAWTASRTQPVTVFAVGQAGAGGDYWLDARVDTGTSQQAIFQGMNPALYAGTAVSSGSVSGPALIGAVFNGTSSKLYIDSTTAAATGNAGTHNCDGLTAGNYAGGGPFQMNGSLTEILVVSGVLSSDDLASVVGYVQSRYGIRTTGGSIPAYGAGVGFASIWGGVPLNELAALEAV